MDPWAQMEICEIKNADKVNGNKNQSGADTAEMIENNVIHHLPDDAAGARHIQVLLHGGEVVAIEVEQSHAGKNRKNHTDQSQRRCR